MHVLSPSPFGLTGNDKKVLTSIFDPESASSDDLVIDSNLAPLPNLQPSLVGSLQSRENHILQSINTSQPSQDQLLNAITELTLLIDENPLYASSYNNRAQVLRLLLGEDLFDEAVVQSSLLTDLSKAIHLASPVSPVAPVSRVQANILAAAHTHRGYLLWMALKKFGSSDTEDNELLASLGRQGLEHPSKERIESMASRDFFMGGRYGNPMAKQMAVRTNPFARMCGSIVKEALQREIEMEG